MFHNLIILMLSGNGKQNWFCVIYVWPILINPLRILRSGFLSVFWRVGSCIWSLDGGSMADVVNVEWEFWFGVWDPHCSYALYLFLVVISRNNLFIAKFKKKKSSFFLSLVGYKSFFLTGRGVGWASLGLSDTQFWRMGSCIFTT